MARLTLADWDLLVRQARAARLLGRLAVQAHQLDLTDRLPEPVRPHLEAAARVAEKHHTLMLWEIRQVQRVLGPVCQKIVLLKGAAYVAAALPVATGRLFSDLDILVPKAELAQVEQTLLAAGWQPIKLHPYDQRYYRAWMHELPPLEHRIRHTTLDVHHTILPETGRLRPDPQKLLADAVELAEKPLYILSPQDMLLHSAAHLFQDGEIGGALRDLVDMVDLIRHFSQQEQFWPSLLARARQLELARPLWYALAHLRWMFPGLVPEEVFVQAQADQPPWPIRPLMNLLIRRAIVPELPWQTTWLGQTARWLLYVRSHWLRMPPRLLVSHLVHKALRRWRGEETGT
ncbi:MAG: nucleotidyltransferase family protein [Thermoguttaceae bacterium]|nr:nucleotidyltransferase family protein [Thermoguttaceae bacterium]